MAYPVREANGVIYAYLGPGEPPLLPNFDWVRASPEYVDAWKHIEECNWLQANEGSIDPSHFSYLHRLLKGRVPDEAKESDFLSAMLGSTDGTEVPISQLVADDVRPDLEIETTSFGFRMMAVRNAGVEQKYIRVTNFLFPNAAVVNCGPDVNLIPWYVPIDDHHTWRYEIQVSYSSPLDREARRRAWLKNYTHDYRPKRSKSNGYLFDVDEQLEWTNVGIGFDVNIQDTWAVEGQGVIQDRTNEHLTSQDRAIVLARRMRLDAIRKIQDGEEPPLVVKDPQLNRFPELSAMETVGPAKQWSKHWRQRQKARLSNCPWAREAQRNLVVSEE